MGIVRFAKIGGHRIFRDFTWPRSLPPFAQFNLIFGWNGTGKTTLSSLLRSIELQRPVTEGVVEIELSDGRRVIGRDFDKSTLPSVRVFNRDFIEETVGTAVDELAPIYYLGKSSVEKQRKVEALRADRQNAERTLADARREAERAKQDLNGFGTNSAREIKMIMRGSNRNRYSDYNRSGFTRTAADLRQTGGGGAVLDQSEELRLRQLKEAPPMDRVPSLVVPVDSLVELEAAVTMLRAARPVAQTLSELSHDERASRWVQEGLRLHTGTQEATKCRFCGSMLSQGRIRALEAHFSDALLRLQSRIDATSERLQEQIIMLRSVTFTDKAYVYAHLGSTYDDLVKETLAVIETTVSHLQALGADLREKTDRPFVPLPEPQVSGQGRGLEAALHALVRGLNEVIREHNAQVRDRLQAVEAACQQLERHYVAKALPELGRLERRLDEGNARVSALEMRVTRLDQQIDLLDQQILELRIPAEELNSELTAYLGHSDLQLDIRSTGYVITRGTQPADRISDGEKSAIALLYFLKSLRDKHFDITKGVVVVDDPVSSLDANSLFSAFGYLKERTKDAGQLFILTHNFTLFRQVRRWYQGVNRHEGEAKTRDRARFYMSQCTDSGGGRGAVLTHLDPLLRDYESDYHYLFACVLNGARGDQSSFGQAYGLPNVARRLLESFLAFRYPGKSSWWALLNSTEFDASRKARIDRFLNCYAHSDAIGRGEHDPSILGESALVLEDVLDLIHSEDPAHFERMVSLVTDGVTR